MRILRFVLFTSVLLLSGTAAFAAGLNICGTTELPGDHSVNFVCGVGANSLTGTATEVVADGFDHIVISPSTVLGTSLAACGGACTGGNTHPSFNGQGVLIASLTGTLNNLPPPVLVFSIGASFSDDTHADNFTGIDALATFTDPGGILLPERIGGGPAFDEENGFYEGSTTLTFALNWNVPAGEEIIFPTSIDMTAEVPEPSYLILAGLCGLAFSKRRTLK